MEILIQFDRMFLFQLTPQVIYTFRIVGSDDENRMSEKQNFSITYKGGELKALQDNVSREYYGKICCLAHVLLNFVDLFICGL